MLIATTNEVAGYDVQEVLGEVFGLTVRSRHIGSQIGASVKSLVGGELGGMTKMLSEGREEAISRLVAEAELKGANGILAMRFDTSELGSNWTEICAYGTAVRLKKRVGLADPGARRCGARAGAERLREIRDEIVGRLDPCRQPHEVAAARRTGPRPSRRASSGTGARSGSRRRRGSRRASTSSCGRRGRRPPARTRRGTRPCRRSRASGARRSRGPGGPGSPG